MFLYMLGFSCVVGFLSLVIVRFVCFCRRPTQPHVAFFHPYCNSGGGGERVLWHSIKAIQEENQRRDKKVKCIVYTGDREVTPEQILKKVKTRFNITLKADVEFVYLSLRSWVEASRYPRFTLLGQSIGSMILGLEALLRFPPDVFFETTGYAFTYPVAWWCGCQVVTYTHYPTISTDMLQRVKERRTAHNNDDLVTKSATISRLKWIYYKFFAVLYGVVGRFASVVLVNSTWTLNHINSIWKIPQRTQIVYPPCDTTEFQKVELGDREDLILSIGQFRPEKDHELQLRAFHKFVSGDYPVGESKDNCDVKPHEHPQVKLVLIGGARNQEDLERVESLKKLAKELGVYDQTTFLVNAPFSDLKKYLSKSLCGLHTMWNEHFGIGVVEFMAAGVIPIAHDSGGPKMDIVVEYNQKPTGFLASDADGYACALAVSFGNENQWTDMRLNARERCTEFSDEEFRGKFIAICEDIIFVV